MAFRMNPVAIVFFILVTNSALLSLALAAGWQHFGRKKHAAMWSGAYALSALSWSISLFETVTHASAWLGLLLAAMSLPSFMLIALGFRHRAGLGLHPRFFTGFFMVAMLIEIALRTVLVHVGLQRASMLFFSAFLLAVAAEALRPGRSTDRALGGGGAFWMVALFALYAFTLGCIALRIPADGAGPARELYRLLLLLGVPAGMFGVGLFAMLVLAADLAGAMRQLASSDPLTGVLNRRGIEDAAMRLIAHSRRHRRSMAVIIADIDRFKSINDRFGHGVGDTVLQRFAGHSTAALRAGDLFGRLGGEEFIFVLPDADGPDAAIAMERVRRGLAESVADLVPDGITVSFGIAMIGAREETLVDMMWRADSALYRSKVDGRDRITVSPAPDHDAPSLDLSSAVRPLRRARA